MESYLVRRASTPEEMAGLRSLREEVFIQEQGVLEELEWDDYDATCLHAVAWNGKDVIGTGRLVLLGNGEGQIGRMAVLMALRRIGIGAEVLRFLEQEARDMGVVQVLLHAQGYVAKFYRGHGYREEGDPFLEAGIRHILMRKSLT